MKRVALGLWFVVSVVGCSSHRAPDDAARGAGGASSGAGAGGTASLVMMGGGSGGLGGSGLSLLVPDASGPVNICSPDLRSVTTDEGVLVQACHDDEQCANGQCLSACDAAATNETSVGCDFYAAQLNRSGCFAAFIANTWATPVTLTAEYAGTALDMTKMARIPSGSGTSITYTPLAGNVLPAGEVAILFLDDGFCSTVTGVELPQTRTGSDRVLASGIDHAVHITTDRPVSAYTINPYGGGDSAVTSSTMLLPTSTWDTNYVAVDVFAEFQDRGLTTQIVAMADATEVTILPTGQILAGGTVAASPAGVSQTYQLNRGEMLELSNHEGLSGSPIQATKPVGVWGTTQALGIPKDTLDVDSGHVEIPPVRALGSEYVAVRYRNRVAGAPEETPPWRLLGVVDGTTLEYEPARPPGAPTTLSAGQLVTFQAEGQFVVRSQGKSYPFYMAQHMTGCRILDPDMPVGCPGGPETINVISSAQYLDRYVFFSDPTYPETDVVVVRERAPDGTFKAVNLDCAGDLSGWTSVGKNFEYTRVDLVRDDFVKQGACDNGRHEIKSDGPFSLTVWGWGTAEIQRAVSYGYTGGAGIREVTEVRVPPVVK